MLQGKTRHLCNDSSKKSCFWQGGQKGYLLAVYALIYEVTVQDDAWDKKDVEPEEMWFGVFIFTKIKISFTDADPPPPEIWKLIDFKFRR